MRKNLEVIFGLLDRVGLRKPFLKFVQKRGHDRPIDIYEPNIFRIFAGIQFRIFDGYFEHFFRAHVQRKAVDPAWDPGDGNALPIILRRRPQHIPQT